VHPQVAPFLTTDRSQGYDASFKQANLSCRIAGRNPARGRLGMYDYLDGFGYLIRACTQRLIAENLRHARRAGFTDYYGEASPTGVGGSDVLVGGAIVAGSGAV